MLQACDPVQKKPQIIIVITSQFRSLEIQKKRKREEVLRI